MASLRDKIVGTSSNTFGIGDGSAGDKYLQAETAAATLPFVRYNDTTKIWEVSHNGTELAARKLAGLVQMQSAKLTANASTTSAAFATFLTLNITTTGLGTAPTILIANFVVTGQMSVTNQSGSFRLWVDSSATIQSATGIRAPSANQPVSSAILCPITGLSAGAHTVTVEWQTNGGTLAVNPVTNPDQHGAALVVMELG